MVNPRSTTRLVAGSGSTGLPLGLFRRLPSSSPPHFDFDLSLGSFYHEREIGSRGRMVWFREFFSSAASRPSPTSARPCATCRTPSSSFAPFVLLPPQLLLLNKLRRLRLALFPLLLPNGLLGPTRQPLSLPLPAKSPLLAPSQPLLPLEGPLLNLQLRIAPQAIESFLLLPQLHLDPPPLSNRPRFLLPSRLRLPPSLLLPFHLLLRPTRRQLV